jgi:hypothetical protein
MKIFIVDKYLAKGISKVFKGKAGIIVHLILTAILYSFLSQKVFLFFSSLSNYTFNHEVVAKVINEIDNPATFMQGLTNSMTIIAILAYFVPGLFFFFLWVGGIISNRAQYRRIRY